MSNQTKTPTSNADRLIGGEYIAVENNRTQQAVSLLPEFVQEPYRGNFHTIINENNTLSVLNTALCDELRALESPVANTVKLRWLEVRKKDDNTDHFLPRQRLAAVSGIAELAAGESGYIYLQMRRTAGKGDISFTDDFLGEVNLQFRWKFAAELPESDTGIEIMPAAAVVVDEEGSICDIVQQQFGIPELWIPSEASNESSSSSDSWSYSYSYSHSDEESESSFSESIPSDSSDSSASSDSWSSSDDFLRPVLINLYYYEEGTEFYDDGVSESWIYEVQMTGTFIADHGQYTAEYTASLEGSGTMTDTNTGHKADIGIIFTVKFTRNESTNVWEMTSEDGPYDWWVDNTTIEEGVKVIDVTVHSFPALDSNPTAPLDTIRVEKIINANQKINSTFRMTFTQQ